MAVLKRFSYDNIVEHNPTAPDPVEGGGGGGGSSARIYQCNVSEGTEIHIPKNGYAEVSLENISDFETAEQVDPSAFMGRNVSLVGWTIDETNKFVTVSGVSVLETMTDGLPPTITINDINNTSSQLDPLSVYIYILVF